MAPRAQHKHHSTARPGRHRDYLNARNGAGVAVIRSSALASASSAAATAAALKKLDERERGGGAERSMGMHVDAMVHDGYDYGNASEKSKNEGKDKGKGNASPRYASSSSSSPFFPTTTTASNIFSNNHNNNNKDEDANKDKDADADDDEEEDEHVPNNKRSIMVVPPKPLLAKRAKKPTSIIKRAFTNEKLRAIMANKPWPRERKKAGAEKPVLKMGVRREYK